jgi:hypothetical protein
MEELLPLIIGILWLAYTFYSKGQKKKQAPGTSPASTTKKKPSLLEQLLAAEGLQVNAPGREEDENEYIYESFEEPVPVPSPVKSKQPIPFLESELSQFEEEGQAQFREAFALDEYEDIQSHLSPHGHGHELMDFDLRKAVLFSAVLDAPYIDYK